MKNHNAVTVPVDPAPPALSSEDMAPAPAAFDYSELDSETTKKLQNLARRAINSKQRYVLDMMEIVFEAHRELVQRLDKLSKHNNQYSDTTFVAWCASIGVGRSTAYNLLQVQALMDNSTADEQEILSEAPAKLLYAAAKPSAPAELVQSVKDGDITTHKQYQEALAQLEAERKAKEEAVARVKGLEDSYRTAHANEEATLRHAEELKQQLYRRNEELQKAKDQRNALLNRQGEYISKIQELETRPVEVAVQPPTEEQIAEAARSRVQEATAMLQAQVHGLQEDLTDARQMAEGAEAALVLAAEQFAAQSAATIDGIRAAFWSIAQELSDEDFYQAATPLFKAADRIVECEWEDEEEAEEEA